MKALGLYGAGGIVGWVEFDLDPRKETRQEEKKKKKKKRQYYPRSGSVYYYKKVTFYRPSICASG